MVNNMNLSLFSITTFFFQCNHFKKDLQQVCVFRLVKCEEFETITLKEIPKVFESLGIDLCTMVKTEAMEDPLSSECVGNFDEDDSAVKVEIPPKDEIQEIEIPDIETPHIEIPDAATPKIKISITEGLPTAKAEASEDFDDSKEKTIPKYETIEEYLQAEQTLTCEVCGKKYYNAYNWRRHRQVMHNILPKGKTLRLKGRKKMELSEEKKKCMKVCHICLEPITSFRKGIFV